MKLLNSEVRRLLLYHGEGKNAETRIVLTVMMRVINKVVEVPRRCMIEVLSDLPDLCDIYIHTCMCVCVYIYIYIDVYVYIYKYIYVYVYI